MTNTSESRGLKGARLTLISDEGNEVRRVTTQPLGEMGSSFPPDAMGWVKMEFKVEAKGSTLAALEGSRGPSRFQLNLQHLGGPLLEFGAWVGEIEHSPGSAIVNLVVCVADCEHVWAAIQTWGEPE